MKRWAIGSIAFFVALGLGTLVAWVALFELNSPKTPPEQHVIEQSLPNPENLNPQEILEVFDDKIDAQYSFSCQLLETGPNFHADQITVRNGEEWLGVFNDNGKFSLRSATVRIKRVPDELVHGPDSDNKGKLTGKSVSVASSVEPLFLVKNSPRLWKGPITTLFVGEREDWKGGSTDPTFLDRDFHHSYELAGIVYELKVIKARNKRDEPILALLLEGDGKRQLLHTFWTRGEGDYGEENWLGSVGTLYWAGDLDRDNNPDFYLSLYAHETIHTSYLLLSSEAEKDNMVKKAAVFSTHGCG